MQELINRAKELLADGTVARVLGWKAGDLPYNPEPAYFETEESLKDFVYNGLLIAPAGSLVYGNATYAKNAGYAYGSGALEINFNQIITPDGNIIAISTEKIYIEEKSERAKKMTRDMLIGALGSMVVGTIFTAIGGGDDWGRNMLIYGGLGAAGGSIRGALQRGEDVDIPDGTTIELKLSQPLNTTPYNKSLQ